MWQGSAIVVAGVLLLGSQAHAEEAMPVDDASRYAMERTDDGVVRLDRKTGEISYCVERPEGWTCRAAADDRKALEEEIARLASENAELKKRLGENGNEAAKTPAETVPPSTKPETDKLPGDKELDQFMDFAEKMMRRFFDMVDRLKKDYDGHDRI